MGAAREKLGRNAKPILLIVDEQSVKNADTAGSKSYDAGTKFSSIKRHIAVDAQRLPHAVAVMTADATYLKVALRAMLRSKGSLDAMQAG